MSKQEQIKRLQELIDANIELCNDCYGDTSDGSLGMCMAYKVVPLKKQLAELQNSLTNES